MLYAGQRPVLFEPPPAILHYGTFCTIEAPDLVSGPWRFNKLSFTGGHAGGFDPHTCDPAPHYFPAPPVPAELLRAQIDRDELSAALLCAEVRARQRGARPAAWCAPGSVVHARQLCTPGSCARGDTPEERGFTCQRVARPGPD